MVCEHEEDDNKHGRRFFNVGSSMTSALADYSLLTTMSHMRCAAHTMQLVILDGLKIDSVASLLSKIRQIAVAVRLPKIDTI